MPVPTQLELIDIVSKVMTVMSSRGGFPLNYIKFDSKFTDIGVGDTAIRSSLLAIRRYIKRYEPTKTITKVELTNTEMVGKLCQLVINKILKESPTDETVKSLIEKV